MFEYININPIFLYFNRINKLFNTSSVESQKGIISVQRCSTENQKGGIAIDFVQQ